MFSAVADYFVYHILNLSAQTNFGAALHFFVYDVLKILFLLCFIIFTISFLQTYLNPQKIKTYIEKQPKFLAHLLAALFGAVTPFCSCSSIPVFIGLIEAKIPFGIAMSFLITSPMINEIAMLVLAGILGIKITLIYIATGICIGMFGGYLLEKLGYAKYLQDYLRLNPLQFTPRTCAVPVAPQILFSARINTAAQKTKVLLRKIWLFILLGVGVGAFLHGYVPQEFFLHHMQADNIFAVPLAVLVGIPLYADATTIIPIAEVLISKGSAIGTVLVFMMAVVGLSLPEMIILSKVMKRPLITRYLIFMALCFIGVGYFYNIIL